LEKKNRLKKGNTRAVINTNAKARDGNTIKEIQKNANTKGPLRP